MFVVEPFERSGRTDIERAKARVRRSSGDSEEAREEAGAVKILLYKTRLGSCLARSLARQSTAGGR